MGGRQEVKSGGVPMVGLRGVFMARLDTFAMIVCMSI